MSFIDFLFRIGFVGEDSWRDKWRNTVCSFCNKGRKCKPWGAWAHQYLRYGGRADMICKKCYDKKIR